MSKNKNKAKNIKSCAKVLLEKYDGNVPKDINELVLLPGVGRKTANEIELNNIMISFLIKKLYD